MSYYAQSRLAKDEALFDRVTACAASEQIPNPQGWSWSLVWQFSAQPGWADAYSYALDTGVQDPGRVEAVISDGQILAAVQALNGREG